MAEDATLPVQAPGSLDAVQAHIIREMQEFSTKNPQIAEALEVMNISLAEYLQAMEAIRGGQTISCSPFGDVQLQVSL
jgi:DNA-directed RNA polymerase specialized sigma subunit